MFNNRNVPCDICDHKEVCCNKEAYENFLKKMRNEAFTEKPDFIRIEIKCIHYNPDIRVKGW